MDEDAADGGRLSSGGEAARGMSRLPTDGHLSNLVPVRSNGIFLAGEARPVLDPMSAEAIGGPMAVALGDARRIDFTPVAAARHSDSELTAPCREFHDCRQHCRAGRTAQFLDRGPQG
eukprot:COSAG01_NODE_35434_length_531_cov_22.576389_1_plen_117_part_10